jgi:hypothetical protein
MGLANDAVVTRAITRKAIKHPLKQEMFFLKIETNLFWFVLWFFLKVFASPFQLAL